MRRCLACAEHVVPVRHAGRELPGNGWRPARGAEALISGAISEERLIRPPRLDFRPGSLCGCSFAARMPQRRLPGRLRLGIPLSASPAAPDGPLRLALDGPPAVLDGPPAFVGVGGTRLCFRQGPDSSPPVLRRAANFFTRSPAGRARPLRRGPDASLSGAREGRMPLPVAGCPGFQSCGPWGPGRPSRLRRDPDGIAAVRWYWARMPRGLGAGLMGEPARRPPCGRGTDADLAGPASQSPSRAAHPEGHFLRIPSHKG
jgi:hypothetical protein